jgi:hypothetical protein
MNSAELSSLTVPQLKTLCLEKNLPISRKKADLLQTLNENLVNQDRPQENTVNVPTKAKKSVRFDSAPRKVILYDRQGQIGHNIYDVIENTHTDFEGRKFQ